MRLELSLYAHRLQNVAGILLGTSDPYAVVTLLPTDPKPNGNSEDSKPVVLGETEAIDNTLSPEWTTTIRLPEYELGSPMRLAVNVCDRSSSGRSMGCVVFEVIDVLAAKDLALGRRLKDGRGTVYASIRQIQGEDSGVIRLTLQCRNLPNVEGGGLVGSLRRRDTSDPFLELSRPMHGGTEDGGGLKWDNVFRSSPAMNNVDPKFDVSMELSKLCGGNLDAPILVTVSDFEKSGRHVTIGSVRTTVNELLNMSSEPSSELTLLAPPGDDANRAAGTIAVLKAQVSGVGRSPCSPESSSEAGLSNDVSSASTNPDATTTSPSPPDPPTFLDYLRGGCRLNCAVAIDFTSSNGDPSHPTSLHYSGASSENEDDGSKPCNVYEQALRAILTPLRRFDDDGLWPVLGFGKQGANGSVSHCFQVGSSEGSKGVDGVITSYLDTAADPDLILAGPMVLTEVLENVANRARESLDKERENDRRQLSYVCFLVVANALGHVAKFEETVSGLHRLRDEAPVSVILVGVRPSPLGDDEDAAAAAVQQMPRPSNSLQELAAQSPDNCTYVEYRSGDEAIDLSRLALHELPDQIVAWFQRHNMNPPLAPPSATAADIAVMDQEEEDAVG